MSNIGPGPVVPQSDDSSGNVRPRSSEFGLWHPFRLLVCLGNVAMGMVSATLSGPLLELPPSPSEGQTLVRYCAKFGEHRTFTLVDGSRLQLNSAACATALYSPQVCLVQQLQPGEAILDVAPDPNRPFIMQTAHASIRVMGTRFGTYRRVVDSTTNEMSLRVAVFEGRVQVVPGGPPSQQIPIRLAAGQQIEIPDAGAAGDPKSMTDRDVEKITAWTEGDIDVDGTVKDILVELDRYQHVCFKTTDPKILQQPFGGRLHSYEVDKALSYLTIVGIQNTSEYDEFGRRTVTLTRGGHARVHARCL